MRGPVGNCFRENSLKTQRNKVYIIFFPYSFTQYFYYR